MGKTTTDTNMFESCDSDNEYSDDPADSDGYLTEHEDRFKTDDVEIYEKSDEEEEEHLAPIKTLQNPDLMEYIRPARKIPTISEMEEEYSEWLEITRKYSEKQEIEKIRLDSEKVSETQAISQQIMDIEYSKSTELRKWRGRGCLSSCSISTLVAVPLSGTDACDYKIMRSAKACIKEMNRNFIWAEESRLANIKEKIANRKAVILGRKAGKARALKKIGPNNNAPKTDKFAVTGHGLDDKTKLGRKADRKIRQAKEKTEWLAANKLLQSTNTEETSKFIVTHFDIEEIAMDSSDEVAEKKEMDLIALKSINSIEKRETEEREMKEMKEKELKQQEKNRFVKIIKKKKIDIFKNFEVGISLISQKRGDRCFTRTKAFAITTGTNKNHEKSLLKTALCSFFTNRKKCPHKVCRFGHNYNDLAPCKFGKTCSLVTSVGNGFFCTASKRECRFKHIGETERSYCIRLHIKFPLPVPVVAKPFIKVKSTINVPDLKMIWGSSVKPKKTDISWASMTSLVPEPIVLVISPEPVITKHIVTELVIPQESAVTELIIDPMVKVRIAVAAINKRIAEEVENTTKKVFIQRNSKHGESIINECMKSGINFTIVYE